MRYLFPITCVSIVLSLLVAQPLEAKGGKGGGGGGHGRPSFSGGHGGGGGGQKLSGQQQSHGRGSKHDPAETDKKTAHAGGKEKDKDQLADQTNKADKDKPNKDKSDGSTTSGDDIAGNTTDAFNKKQKQLEIEQRNRDKRIAQAQHLREIAERNGNQNLMANADRMEAFAYDHYARRVAQLEKFGVTDPTLNSGGGLTDPLSPGEVLLDNLGLPTAPIPSR